LSLDYGVLLRAFRRGIRNGEWHKLGQEKRGLFRCALEFLKKGARIVRTNLVKELLDIIKALTSPLKRTIWQKGLEVANAMRKQLEEGVFSWCPKLKDWLQDPDYIFYLGVSSVNSMYWGGVRS